jgi:hypothetical protein
MMFALWGADHEALLVPGDHGELASYDVERLQLNLDDAGVAEALMRLQTGEAINAVVSIWGGSHVHAPSVLAWLRERAERVEGWLVGEHRRLDPPTQADGVRADALANMALLRCPEGLTRAEWLRRWMEDHTGVAIRTQASFGYVQNVVQAPLTVTAPEVDGIVEELFPSAGMTDPHAFYGSGGGDDELARRMNELLASVARIGADRDLDLVPTSRYCFSL